MIQQYHISLSAKSRGFHLVTNEILELIPAFPLKGIFNLFIKHTSAGLTISENADPDVRLDFESIFNQLVPENLPFLKHTLEGPDDMPAHIKTSLVGVDVSIPIVEGRLALGTWQGIYLCEFRNKARGRNLIATITS